MDIQRYLPTILQREHIAQLADNRLLIGDRRAYPWEISYVCCSSVQEIALAVREMVTQGGGPLQVGLTSMQFIARQIQRGVAENHAKTFLTASRLLAESRPTNTTMARTLTAVVANISRWYLCKDLQDVYADDLVAFVDEIIDQQEALFDAAYDTMSDIGAGLLPDHGGVLTTCFAEHSFLLSLAKAKEQGKQITVDVPETRPYLQGARLTAPSLAEIGIDAYVITDGMGAHVMQESRVQQYFTAADLVAMDGTVVNKVGTLANAISAHYYHIPYYVFAMSPDTTVNDSSAITMEERSGKEVLQWNRKATTVDTMKGYYPAFDIIDASLVSTIITPKGSFHPQDISAAYRER